MGGTTTFRLRDRLRRGDQLASAQLTASRRGATISRSTAGRTIGLVIQNISALFTARLSLISPLQADFAALELGAVQGAYEAL